MAFGRWLTAVALGGVLAAGCEYLAPAAGDRPTGGFECLGVAPSKCADYLDQARSRGPVAAIRIRCTSATCTDAQGEIEITVWRPDGSVEQSGAGWMAPVEAPPVAPPQMGGGDSGLPTPPVTPSCVGVPIEWCHNMASEVGMPGWDFEASDVVSITIRCTTVCTPTSGEGQTLVILRDGRRIEPAWSYEGAVPPTQ